MAVYMIRAGADGPVKIGHAGDPRARLSDLQTGHWEKLRIIRLFEGSADEEAVLHVRFSSLHIKGEWHSFSQEMLEDVGLRELALPIQSRTVKPGIHLDWPKNTGLPAPADLQKIAGSLGRTLAEVCREAGIAPSTFCRWKNGTTKPRLDVFERFINATEHEPVA